VEIKQVMRETYRAPRDVRIAAPELVTRTPHRSMAGMMLADAIANIKFLTPLEHRSVGTATNITNQNRRGPTDEQIVEPAGM